MKPLMGMVIGVLAGFVFSPILVQILGWGQDTIVGANIVTIFFIIGVLVNFVTLMLSFILYAILDPIQKNIIIGILYVITTFVVAPPFLFLLLINYLFNNPFSDIRTLTTIGAVFGLCILLPAYPYFLYMVENDSLSSLIWSLLLPSIIWAMIFPLPLSQMLPGSSVEYICTKYPFITTVPIIIPILFAIAGYIHCIED